MPFQCYDDNPQQFNVQSLDGLLRPRKEGENFPAAMVGVRLSKDVSTLFFKDVVLLLHLEIAICPLWPCPMMVPVVAARELTGEGARLAVGCGLAVASRSKR